MLDRECFGNLSLVLDLVGDVLGLGGGSLPGLAAGPEHGAEVAVGGGEPQHGQHVGHQAEHHLPNKDRSLLNIVTPDKEK